jgi:2'-phosphotransferase
MSELAEIVASNDKKRFSIIPASQDGAEATAEAADADAAVLSITAASKPADYLIRANQGHSIKVETDGLAVELSLDDPDSLPKTVVHGTNRSAWPAILSTGGLKPMGRNHVHFATGLPAGFKTFPKTVAGAVEAEHTADEPVISGMRNISSVLVYIDLEKAMRSGLKFWKSENGVILTDGGEKGVVPLEFFKRVEERGTQGGILAQDGVVIRELRGKGR